MSLLDFLKANDYKETISQLKNENIKLENQVRELQEFIHSRLPYFDFETLPYFGDYEDFPNIWNQHWKFTNHNSDYQRIRQLRASQVTMTPIKLDRQAGTALFRGEECDYTTSLISCQCMDFQRRCSPCKHIYRVAHELDVFLLKYPVESVPEPDKLLSKQDLKNRKLCLSSTSAALLSQLIHSNNVIVKGGVADQLLRYNLAIIDPSKYDLLNTFKKDELLAMLPDNISGLKSAKKAIIIEKIINEFPEIVTKIEKNTVSIKLSPYAYRLR